MLIIQKQSVQSINSEDQIKKLISDEQKETFMIPHAASLNTLQLSQTRTSNSSDNLVTTQHDSSIKFCRGNVKKKNE